MQITIKDYMFNLKLLVYVGHLAVVVALQALSLSLLPLAAPSAALGPAIAVGTPGTEALCFITTDPPTSSALAALVTRA